MTDDFGLSELVTNAGHIQEMEGKAPGEFDKPIRLFYAAESELKKLLTNIQADINSINMAREYNKPERIPAKQESLRTQISRVTPLIPRFEAFGNDLYGSLSETAKQDPKLAENHDRFVATLEHMKEAAQTWPSYLE